ncbi:MAG: rRNA maturation RNase YbeY [Candidatus Levybacteria bacterium]|nr:rRNA maturation RNase YbeY [Candidatus Levybacteria bacterium]MSU26015.1 rRNA maturation RNase YbeY [Candidatus Levybacteria bacterium]
MLVEQRKMHGNSSTIEVLLFVESRYKVDRKRIKKAVQVTCKEQGIISSAEISIAIVGDRKMQALNKKYRNIDKTTNVLSFSINEGSPTIMPTDKLRLGDVVLSYPQVIRDAARDDVLVDEKVEELVIHGTLHLLGVHH